jgi:hypothetical protein
MKIIQMTPSEYADDGGNRIAGSSCGVHELTRIVSYLFKIADFEQEKPQ